MMISPRMLHTTLSREMELLPSLCMLIERVCNPDVGSHESAPPEKGQSNKFQVRLDILPPVLRTFY
jgi:hypothetical protein